MPGLYSHVTRSSGTTLTANIYNTDHQNHIDNAIPEQIDDYSVDVTEMRATTDPGEAGSESQPTSLAGELERLRFTLNEVTGKSQWYETPDINLLSTSNGGKLPQVDQDETIPGAWKFDNDIDIRTVGDIQIDFDHQSYHHWRLNMRSAGHLTFRDNDNGIDLVNILPNDGLDANRLYEDSERVGPIETATVELTGDFASGTQQVYCRRDGERVTVTSIGTLSHDSQAIITSGANDIPSNLAPSHTLGFMYRVDGTSFCTARIDSSGRVIMTYTDETGSGVIRSDTAMAFSISYLIT